MCGEQAEEDIKKTKRLTCGIFTFVYICIMISMIALPIFFIKKMEDEDADF